jgi:serine phosphatase RsbU (regulator of sigma subunit)
MVLYQHILFTTLAISFGLLHLFLFIYNPRLKSDLYFSLFLFFYALNIFFDYQALLATNWKLELEYLRIHRAVLPFNPIFALLFAYSVFDYKIPKQFWIISAGLIISGGFAVYDPVDNFLYIQFFLIAVFFEAVRVFGLAIYQKKEGARLITSGFVLLFLFSMYDMILDFGLMKPVYNIVNGYPFGFAILILIISIYLARDFAKINKKVISQEIKTKEMEISQRLLEAEHRRKSKELEEARTLQISMLPQCLPEMNGMDICFDMKTATEVGGDYYDYYLADDGELTIAIGDATGHGMKAGIMVSIIKSLFISHAPKMHIHDFFERCSQTLRQMKFKNLYMSMLLVKIKDQKLITSSAGMPPILLFRNRTQLIEELVTKGLPLGVVERFDYQTVETKLEVGDVLLLMSDGLPELFNDQNEVLDYSGVKRIFQEAVELPSNQILRHILMEADKWRNGQKQKDDVTLVAVKIQG